MCELLDIDALKNPDFATAPVRLQNKAFIEGLVEEKLKTKSSQYWLAELEQARIPCARVNNVAQALADPQVLHRKMVVDVKHPEGGSAKVPGNPIKLSVTDEESYSPPPLLGAHTKEVFTTWAGMGEDEIEAALKTGVIG